MKLDGLSRECAQSSSTPSLSAVAERDSQSADDLIEPYLPLHTLNTLRNLLEKLCILTTKTIPFPSLHDDLQRASLQLTHLSARSLHALRLFRSAAVKERHDVAVVQDLLRDQLHTAAHSLLTASRSEQNRLASVSNSLALAFEQAAINLTTCLTEATHARAHQTELREQKQSAVAHKFSQLNDTRRRAQGALRAFEDADMRHSEAEERERVARRRVVALQAAHVAAVIGGFVSPRSTPFVIGAGSAAALANTFEGEVLRAREERAVHLRQRNDARERHSLLEGSVASLVTELRECRKEQVLESGVLDTLVECALILRELAGVMLQAEAFWKGVATGLQDGLLELVNAAEGRLLDDAMKERFEQVEQFWGAVGRVCDRAMRGVDSGLNNNGGLESRRVESIAWDTA